MNRIISRIEESYGAVMTYSTSIVTAGIGTWIGENWFLILSAIAVLIRIGIDLPQLIKAWKKEKQSLENK